MKVAVTGGSGFIGSHVVDKLKDKGHDVAVIDMIEPHRKDVEFRKASITNPDEIVEALKGVDVVYHLAADGDVTSIEKNPRRAVELNVLATANVLEAARVNNLKRVLFASTVWTYTGHGGKRVNEDTVLPHMNAENHLYTCTKLASENLCKAYHAFYKIPTTILRFGIPYGPRARPNLVMAIFIRKAQKNEPVTLDNGGRQTRPFLYVGDLAEGCVAALDEKAAGEVYNLCSNKEVSIKDVADTVKEHFPNLSVTVGPPRPGDFQGAKVSPEKAKEELGWKATTDLKTGLKNYINWLRSDDFKIWTKIHPNYQYF